MRLHCIGAFIWLSKICRQGSRNKKKSLLLRFYVFYLEIKFKHWVRVSHSSNSGVLTKLSADPIPSSSSSSLLLSVGLLMILYCPIRLALTVLLFTAHRGSELLEYSSSRRLASSDLNEADSRDLLRKLSRFFFFVRSGPLWQSELASWLLRLSRSDPMLGSHWLWTSIELDLTKQTQCKQLTCNFPNKNNNVYRWSLCGIV